LPVHFLVLSNLPVNIESSRTTLLDEEIGDSELDLTFATTPNGLASALSDPIKRAQ